jgi:hypothetical protein
LVSRSTVVSPLPAPWPDRLGLSTAQALGRLGHFLHADGWATRTVIRLRDFSDHRRVARPRKLFSKFSGRQRGARPLIHDDLRIHDLRRRVKRSQAVRRRLGEPGWRMAWMARSNSLIWSSAAGDGKHAPGMGIHGLAPLISGIWRAKLSAG